MKQITSTFITIISSLGTFAQPIDSLPVRINTLEAKSIVYGIRLDWSVVCFLEFAKFQIQRSSDGINYTTINAFEADKLRCKQPFDFTDANIGGTLFYKINVGDRDGRYSSSKVVTVTLTEKKFAINSIAPSLVNSEVLLSLYSPNIDKVSLFIINFNGVILRRQSIDIVKGVSDIRINVGNMPKGNYILKVQNGFLEERITRFTRL
ncbi:hypothetical protein ACFOW1_15615 [Parasediminibacterium paludis]|uniref:Secreted protein (Por secretion system target) n=1 Tax=Parasediminibacterium paludis TaxID=908966 RepID=A0ABV8Q0I4_9BACT